MIKETDYLTFKNRTCTYLLPLLGESIHEFRNLIQCFVADKDTPEEKGRLYLLFKIEKQTWFNDFFKFLTTHKLFERYYKIYDEYIMVVYKLDEHGLDKYNKFIKGSYSKLGEDYKAHILNFYNLGYGSEVAKVLFRREDKYIEWEKRLGVKIPRSQEIGNLPDKEYEVFDKDKMFINNNSVVD